jgi:PPE-repeat protein
MDFGALPPEINSLRMYTGPGPGPMMAAAAAWNNLAAELGTAASSSQSVISELTGAEWLGSASASMAAATAPYVAWMHTTTGLLQQAAAQAMASAAAFEAAFAMTVPPPVIAANRALLAGLVATNILGQNTATIAATEAQYGQMWAQDAAAMYGYAASSTTASKLSLLNSPSPTINAAGLAGQAAAATPVSAATAQTGLQGLISNLPSAMQSLAAPAAAPAAVAGPLDTLLGNNVVQALGNGITDTAAWNMMEGIATANVVNATVSAPPAAGASDALGAGLGGGGVLAGSAGLIGPGAGGAPVLAGMGQASQVGKLAVPASWSAAAPAEPVAAAPLAGSGWTAPVEEGGRMSTVATGMPAYASAGRGGYAMGPRYGVKPTVMPRHLVV